MSILETNYTYSSFGIIRYFQADRCFNNNAISEFNCGQIKAEELITFDCGLMEMQEISASQITEKSGCKQILAVIIRPEIEPNYTLGNDKRFEFCGYDLTDIQTNISAITNCGAEFDKAINYSELNSFGLFPDYHKAIYAQLALNDKYDDSHAYCEIVEIWRWLKH